MSSQGRSPGPGVRGRSDALPTPSAGISSRFSLGRIICAMEGPYHPLDDEAMLQAADEVEAAAAAAVGGVAGDGVAREPPPAHLQHAHFKPIRGCGEGRASRVLRGVSESQLLKQNNNNA